MSSRILVTGGTGQLGGPLIQRLLGAGREVTVMSRRPRPVHDRSPYSWATVDFRSGSGLVDAARGTDAVAHCATAYRPGAEIRLLAAIIETARRARVRHLVYVSIVGVDRVPLGYYRGKLAAERLLENSGLPYTILRATQFHQLLHALFARVARAPVMPVPGFQVQPVDAGEVAVRLAEVVAGEPLGRVPDFAGPAVRQFADLAHAYLRAAGKRRLVRPVRWPGELFRAYRDGHHLAPGSLGGTITFEQYLAARPDVRHFAYRGRRS